MSRRHRTPITPGLYTFISKAITPAVLLFGVILLIFFNFKAVLTATKITDDHFHGNIAFSQKTLALRFQENAGIDRPALANAGQDLITYSEWSSTVSVDGNVQELWNNYHGYDVDETRRQVYSTTSGHGWQLGEIITLVNDHTATVTFTFDARPSTLPGPARYVFDIAHATSTSYEWYNYQAGNGAFSAQVIAKQGNSLLSKPSVFGTLSLRATGEAVHTPTLSVVDGQAIASRKNNIGLANNFITEYIVNNPPPDKMITLGTETLTFTPAATAPGAPLPGPGVVPSVVP